MSVIADYTKIPRPRLTGRGVLVKWRYFASLEKATLSLDTICGYADIHV